MDNQFPYEDPMDVNFSGINRRTIQKVAARFIHQQQQGKFPGGQLVARQHDKVILKLNCGIARGWHSNSSPLLEVEASTPFAVYSTGKPMAATVIALLESQGTLDIHTTVAKVLPEFSGLGRDKITIEDVLTHRAGIILSDLIHNHKIWGNNGAVWQHLLKTPPRYPRGTFAYMPGEYGIILDQLVRRLTGESIATTFHQQLAVPLGLNNIQFGLGTHQLDELAWAYWLGKPRYMIAEMDVADRFEEKNNDPAVFSAGNPAFSMTADAANLAAFYEFLANGGKTRDGTQLIDMQLIKRYTTRQIAGWNKSVKTHLSLGYGFMLGTATPSFFGWWGSSLCFGHPGMFSSLAFADYKTGLSMAIITNGNRSMSDFFFRMVPLIHAMRKAC